MNRSLPNYPLTFRYGAGLEFLLLVILFMLLLLIPGVKCPHIIYQNNFLTTNK